jgi:hypothetical protein
MFGLRLLSLAVFPLLVLAAGANAEECRPTDDVLAGNSKLPVVRKYVCGPASQAIEVTFLRLNEAIIGSLLRDEKIPGLEFLWKDAIIAETEPAIESRTLFEKFGRVSTFAAEDAEMAITSGVGQAQDQSVKLSTLSPGAFPSGSTQAHMSEPGQTITTLSAPFFELSQRQAGYEIYIPDFEDAYNNKTSWPNGYKFFYDCDWNAIECTNLWRYLKSSEFSSVEKATKKNFESLKPDKETRKEYQALYEGNEFDREINFKNHLKLCSHLTKTSSSDDFLLVVGGTARGCGDLSSHATYYLPRLTVTIALIKNGSSRPSSVDENKSFQSAQTGLRQAQAKEDNVPLSDGNKFVIPPGITMIVPVAINFKASLPEIDVAKSVSMWKRISKKPDSSVFRHKYKGRVEFSKSKSSFLPPEYPGDADFVYGPKIHFMGLTSGEASYSISKNLETRLSLPGNSDESNQAAADEPVMGNNSDEPSTELTLTTNYQPGQSCPYLAYWDAARGEWVTKSKVLDKAKGEKNEVTEAVTVPRQALRFRLTEEEPEIAYIRDVKLKIRLNNDTEVELSPANIGRQLDGGLLYRIPPYTSVEFSFDIPDQYRREIREQRLEVRGYYRRISEIVASAK